MSDPFFIRGWQRLSERVTTSGMPKREELEYIAELGVTRVVDLTSEGHEEALQGEPEELARLGVTYHHLPVPFDRDPEEHYLRFAELIAASDEPTHVHCVANWRVSCFFYRYHLEHGIPENEARAIMRIQWEPDVSDHPIAAPWKAFVERAKVRMADQSAATPADLQTE